MIEVTNITKRYGNHTAVDRISFNAKPGEIVGLLGPNGAGKTTTMRILTGFMPPTEGTARISGFDVMEDSMEVRRRVGYMPEHVPIYPDMTLRGYVMFWAKLRGVRKAHKRADHVLEQFGLYDRRKHLVRSLSKGLKQRLGLAQAIVHEPEVIILDEPTIGIDPRQVIEVREIVRSLRQEHTVLFSSHILSEVEQVCDRVIILDRGRVVASGAPAELSKQFKPGVHLYVAVGGDAERAQRVLEKAAQVITVRPEGDGFVVSGATEHLRSAIVKALSKHDLELLEMRPVDAKLEDIFLNIVR